MSINLFIHGVDEWLYVLEKSHDYEKKLSQTYI